MVDFVHTKWDYWCCVFLMGMENWVVVLNISIFIPKIGEMIQFDFLHIFQMG